MKEHFDAVAGALESLTKPGEIFLANYRAEHSDFVRFNKSALRQPGRVEEIELSVELILGKRHAEMTLNLSGRMEDDRARLGDVMTRLREIAARAPEDPYLLINEKPSPGARTREGKILSPREAADAILAAGHSRDMVGIYAAGPVYTGFANNLGQRNFDATASFNLDWSFYHAGDKAVKSAYAGFEWSDKEFHHAVAGAGEKLKGLYHEPRTIPPGSYRAYLTPAALNEIMNMLAWGGYGLAAQKTRSTIFLRMIEGNARLSPIVTIRENTDEGASPAFQREGFIKPGCVTMVEGGLYRDALVSPRSAVEYGAATNAANAYERPLSVEMLPGDLDEADVLKRLGTGVYVSNLWYLNFSDRSAGRLTGMTRFGTFWVENGEIVAPLNVMRFDDTIYNMLGENLEALTRTREFLLDPSTYEGRSTESAHLPGALLSSLRLTL